MGLKLGWRPAVRDFRRCEGLHREKCHGRERGRICACEGAVRLVTLGAMLETKPGQPLVRIRNHRRAVARCRLRHRSRGQSARQVERPGAGVRGQCPLQPEESEQGHDSHETAASSAHAKLEHIPLPKCAPRGLGTWHCGPRLEPDQAFLQPGLTKLRLSP